MKYVYALVSGIEDVYYEQTLVSITSLRIYMPNAYVALVADDLTAKTLIGTRNKIKELVDEFVVVNLDKNTEPVIRSRQLKTSLRNLINRDFLYIDNDTVIVSDLSSISETDYEIAAVLDLHSKMSEKSYTKPFYNNAKKLNFSPYKNDCYFNSGVLYVKDTETTRAFYKRWNELWSYCISKGYRTDQPSLAQTDFEYEYIIKELPGEWNCQIEACINYLENAKIIHFFSSLNSLNVRPHHVFMDKRIYYNIKNNDGISEDTIKIIRNVKTSFYKNTLIINPEMIITRYSDIVDKNLFEFINGLYNRCRIIFNILNYMTIPIIKIARKFLKR